MNIIEARTYDIDSNLIEVLTGKDARAIAEVPNLVGALRDFVTHYAGPLRGQLGNGYAYQWYDRAQAILKRIED